MPKIEIDNLNTVRIWLQDESAEKPTILQPHWPDGTAWQTKAEAEGWATAYVEAYANPESEFLPGDTPGQPLKLRPTEPVEEENA